MIPKIGSQAPSSEGAFFTKQVWSGAGVYKLFTNTVSKNLTVCERFAKTKEMTVFPLTKGREMC